MSIDDWLGLFGLVALFLPVAASLALGLPWVLGAELSEATIRRTVGFTFGLALLACLGIDGIVLLDPDASRTITLARWLTLPAYAVDARVVFDLPAAVLMTLTALLTGLIGAFSAAYLHQDPGFRRFFVLLPLFAAGMMAIASGETLDLVFAGWEVVGIASALLIAYFQYREAPVRHGLRAFAVYRTCDVALLTAAVLLHHHAGEASLTAETAAHLEGDRGLWIALLLVFAVMGKAAAFPFTGWLPRAMEGPTPSSAIFYGALSVHAAPFLLVRAWPLLEAQPVARWVLGGVALLTAAHATMVGRVQTDVKSTLAYASATQVAVILGEVALGWTGLALVHMSGHAVLRTWQLLRAPSLLHDHHELLGRLQGGRPPRGTLWERLLPVPVQRFGYHLALERWFVDDVAAGAVFGGLTGAFAWLDRVDRAWTALLAGRASEEGP